MLYIVSLYKGGYILADNTQNTGTGYLKVIVTTGDNALPIAGATVTVTSGAGNSLTLINKQSTNSSGETEQISLAAPPKELSLTPGNTNTFAKYNVRVDFPGYYTVENIDVPVFDGQVSMQPTQMIPLPTNDNSGKKITVYENQIEL